MNYVMWFPEMVKIIEIYFGNVNVIFRKVLFFTCFLCRISTVGGKDCFVLSSLQGNCLHSHQPHAHSDYEHTLLWFASCENIWSVIGMEMFGYLYVSQL